MRTRLRDLPDLSTTYPKPHEHHHFPDHLVRVGVTREIARWMVRDLGEFSVMDLSCGDGSIAQSLGTPHMSLGDYAHGDHIDYVGPIEESVKMLAGSDTRHRVDLFINCETIEHLDDPDTVLQGIRQCGQMLLLSTPVGAHDDGNPEHVWSWDREDVEAMLTAAGFEPFIYTELDPRSPSFPYAWGIWGAR